MQEDPSDCNQLVESLVSRDEKLFQKVIDQDDESKIKNIINRLPVKHIRTLLIELGNLVSSEVSIRALKWIQLLVSLRYSVISTMPDGRSILMPIISILEDRSSPNYYNKLCALKGKLTLLQQVKETRRIETAENVVRVSDEQEKAAQMEIDSDTDTEDELQEGPDEDEEVASDDENGLDALEGEEDDDDNEEEEFYDLNGEQQDDDNDEDDG